MNSRTLAILAAFGASAIYGMNHTIAKGLMPVYIKPYGLILLRVVGAAILFWILSIWGPKERIEPKDRLRLLACAVFGMVINMLMFFKGLSLSTPINSSVIITLSPIIVFILSAILIGEKITLKRSLGILTGFAGALLLVLYGQEIRQDAPNIPLGNSLFLINATSYAIYLVLAKPLTAKYHAITLMKWLFLIAIFINLPITLGEFMEVQWRELPFEAIWKMAFVVIGTTFMTYLLNIYALKVLRASTIGAFIYLQPIIAIVFALMAGADTLSPLKLAAAAMVFSGVYLVSRRTAP
ncbi:DMT family transporter [Robertkochia sediminum]|uniref:DMT family transporter n=1 Tax=Robertkochia sediminum TaxID=2785326 RepID=UPI001932A8C5|nr:DMT family transporter [Robertkochia sediminum]MBL7471912.1 DMT family transporter [Robertkochia sediminum]